jgi:hypothetical protein
MRAFTIEKIAEFAPMESASVRITVTVKPGLPKLAQSVASILQKTFHAGTGTIFPYCLLYLLDAAELSQRSTAGLGCRYAGSDPFVHDHVNVSTKLSIELVLNLLLPEEIVQGAANTGPECHHSLPSLLSMRSSLRGPPSPIALFRLQAGFFLP